MIAIRVEGRPAPQGSKTKGAHGGMREASIYLAPWRAKVRNTAHYHLNALGFQTDVRPYFRGAVVVRRLEFIMLAEQQLDGKPDLDKLTRAVFDALTYAGLWADDGLVVRIERLSERHALPGEPPGCYIEVEPFQETEQDQMTQKLYRLVLEEVELNGGAPVTVGQVVGDAAMVESVLPALAQRLSIEQRGLEPQTMSEIGTGLVMAQAANGVVGANPDILPAEAPPAEVKRPRGRPRKNAAPPAEPAAPAPVQPVAPVPAMAAPAAPAAYDPFKQVAGVTPQ